MQPLSSNFAFLAAHDQGLARLGALAEWAFHHDPPTTLGKLRLFAELLAKLVAARHAIEVLPRESFEAVLRLLRDRGVLPRQPAELFHYIRRVGNAAVHDNLGTPAEALSALKQARQLGIWFTRGYGGDSRFNPGPFRPPEPTEDASVELRAEIVRLRSALVEQQSANESNAHRLEAEARARETAEQQVVREAEERALWEAFAAEQEGANVALAAQLRALRENAEVTAPSDRAALLQQSEQAAEAIELDEADTRLIIDAKLRAIGWRADTNRLRHALGTRPDPNGAIAVAEWPTESGPVDYALFLKGRCIGVIEAKKVSTDVPAVLEQTKRYARGINLGADAMLPDSPWQHGQESAYRVPFMFATNGRPFVKQLANKSGIWFWDARGVTHVPGALPEWFSPTGRIHISDFQHHASLANGSRSIHWGRERSAGRVRWVGLVALTPLGAGHLGRIRLDPVAALKPSRLVKSSEGLKAPGAIPP